GDPASGQPHVSRRRSIRVLRIPCRRARRARRNQGYRRSSLGPLRLALESLSSGAGEVGGCAGAAGGGQQEPAVRLAALRRGAGGAVEAGQEAQVTSRDRRRSLVDPPRELPQRSGTVRRTDAAELRAAGAMERRRSGDEGSEGGPGAEASRDVPAENR